MAVDESPTRREETVSPNQPEVNGQYNSESETCDEVVRAINSTPHSRQLRPQPTPQERLSTAFHEAGHAVVALALGRVVGKVTIEPKQMKLGQCEIKKGRFGPRHDHLETEMLVLLAGPAAEARHVGRYDWAAASQDLKDLRGLARHRAPNDRQAARLERRMLDKVESLLDDVALWETVCMIANALVEKTEISGRAARHLFETTREKYRE